MAVQEIAEENKKSRISLLPIKLLILISHIRA